MGNRGACAGDVFKVACIPAVVKLQPSGTCGAGKWNAQAGRPLRASLTRLEGRMRARFVRFGVVLRTACSFALQAISTDPFAPRFEY